MSNPSHRSKVKKNKYKKEFLEESNNWLKHFIHKNQLKK